jgi:hypothetical protein
LFAARIVGFEYLVAGSVNQSRQSGQFAIPRGAILPFRVYANRFSVDVEESNTEIDAGPYGDQNESRER